MTPPPGTHKPLTTRQLKAIDLRVDGNSWGEVSRQLIVTERSLRTWRKHPDWEPTLKARQKEWVEEYENRFTRMLPKVAHTHDQLLNSQSEVIRMRAVDSAHSNHVRCVREQETKTEVKELKDIVRMLMAQLQKQAS